MATYTPQRPLETRSTDVEPAPALRGVSPVRTAAAIAAASAVFLALVVLLGVGRLDGSAPAFLEDALGPEQAQAPLERSPAPGVGVRIHDEGYTVTRWGLSVSVVSEDVGGAEWRRHVHGVTRETDFGSETIVVDGSETEEFLTVAARQGERTWRWKLGTRLVPRLGRDGSVGFLDPKQHQVTGIVVDPVRILDGEGEEVTPDGLRWGIEESRGTWWLTLDLDDAELPLPYVIDPAIGYRTSATADNGGGSASLTIGVPAGTAEKDLLVVHLAVRANATITAPAGWTELVNDNNGNFLRQAAYYRVADGSEPTSYQWTLGPSVAAAGGMSAFYGIRTTNPVDVADTTTATGNSGTVSAASLTTTANGSIVLALFSARADTAFSQATGMTERYESRASGGISVATDTMTQATAGATGGKLSTVTSSRWSGTQVSFRVDDVLPSGSVSDPGANLSGTVVLNAAASDLDSAVTSVQFQSSPAGAGTWTDIGAADTSSPYSVPYDTTGMPDGLYDLRVVVTDGAGNVFTSSAATNRRVDNTAPGSTTAFPADGTTYGPSGWNAGCATSGFCGAHSDTGSGVASVEVSIQQGAGSYWSGGSFSSGTEVWNAATLAGGDWSYAFAGSSFSANGAYTVRVRAADAAGNVQTPASRTFTIDATAPQTTIDSGPADPTASTDADVTFSASEGGSSFECRLDDGAWNDCTSPATLAGLADGSHAFTVRATDTAGNADPTPASHTWNVDTQAPETTLDDVPADPSADDAPSFAFSADEPAATFECRVDGGAWTPCTSPETAGLLTDGPHTFDVRAADAAGNADVSPASHAWIVDTTPPATSFTTAPTDPSNDRTPDFAFASSEPGSTFECRLDGGVWSTCASPLAVGPLADGGHTFEARATDSAGNVGPAPAEHAWLVDAVAPSVTITEPAGFVTAADADPYTVRAASPDGDVTGVELFRCSDDSASCATGTWVSLGVDATAPYEASWPLDPDGSRALRAVVTDAASNTAEHVVDVMIDRTVPATTIDSAPADPSGTTDASFLFSASEPGAGFECRLDGGAWTPCSSPRDYSGLSEGDHDFAVRASDAAGNVDATPATHAWAVDTIAPETAIDVGPADPSADASPAFEFSADEPGATFECRLDDGAWNDCTSPATLAGLADGGHTFTVRATDAAGNADPIPASHVWTVDATPPGGGLADPGQYLRGTVALSASPSDTGAGVQRVEFQVSPAGAGAWTSIDADTTDPYGASWDTTAVADGPYDLRVVVTDHASNQTPSEVVADRLVDNTAPAAAMDDPGAYLRATVELTSSVSDAGSAVASVVYERSPAGEGAWTPVAAAWDTTALADGLYDLRVRVADKAGNSLTSAPVAGRRVDNTKPSLTSSTPSDGTVVASAGSLQVVAGEDLAGLAGAEIDGAPAGAPAVAGASLMWTQAFAPGPHVLSGELEDLAGNRQPIRVHFTVWSGATADYPYVEKNSESTTAVEVRSASDTATVRVPAGAWSGGAPGDWLVVRIDPQPAGVGANGFQPAGEALDVTAYWALAGTPVTSFGLPLELELDYGAEHVVPATWEGGSWRVLRAVPGGSGLPAAWDDGFERDGTNVRILTRHLTLFTLLEDVEAPQVPGGFRGVRSGKRFTLSWSASKDNSGLISAYRIYANGSLVKLLPGNARSTAMGAFSQTDTRSFQIGSVDEAGNESARSKALRIVPKVTKLTLTAAGKALQKRGFKLGKVSRTYSPKVASGKVVSGVVGLRVAGSKIPLVVSKGRKPSRRPVVTTAPPPPPPSSGDTTPPPAPAPVPAPAAPASPPALTAGPAQGTGFEPPAGGTIPAGVAALAGKAVGLTSVRRELGFALLAAAFILAFAALLRARRPLEPRPEAGEDDELLWERRLVRGIGGALGGLAARPRL